MKHSLNLDELFPVVKGSLDMEPYRVDWLVNDLWQYKKINALTGYVKTGKSRLLSYVLGGLSNGNVLGLNCRLPNRIIYLAGEEPVPQINERIAHYARLQRADPSAILERIDFITAVGMQLQRPEYQRWFVDKLVNEEYDMMIIDPLRRVHSADENSNNEMAAIMNAMRQWANKQFCTIIFVHHTPKPNLETDLTRMETWFRGASDIAAIVDTATFLDKLDSQTLQLRREGRFAPLPHLIVRDLGHEPDRGFETVGVRSKRKEKVESTEGGGQEQEGRVDV
jgi:RecA-family ATPase